MKLFRLIQNKRKKVVLLTVSFDSAEKLLAVGCCGC